MFEFLQTAKNGELRGRIFPIVLGDARIYEPLMLIEYVKYWETRYEELNEAMKSVSAANLQGLRDDIDLYAEIRSTIAELATILRDMNTLTPEAHRQSGYAELCQAVHEKLAE